MRREKTSVSQEDYLKAIWEIVQEEQVPISARLAEDLGVTPPAVTAALKRMTRSGHLRVRRDGRIELSTKGRSAAQHLVLRHRLAEKLLIEVIGLEWSRAHEEAERLEHGISPEVSRLLLERFGRDSRCPHGVPLLGGMAQLRRKHGAVRLSAVDAGHSYEVMRVYEKDPRFLEFLDARKLRPNAHVRVIEREYDETMAVVVGKGNVRLHLGKPATERIWVKRVT
jgi:DtxR family transcriptional regulator, Mn-dependent transcriptional regulator